jgi:hypothetical protein
VTVTFLNWEVGFGSENPSAVQFEIISFDESQDMNLITMGLVSICKKDQVDIKEIKYVQEIPLI